MLSAEIIEKKLKTSVPIGELGQDAFGNIPSVEDKGMMMRSILNIGHQDMNVDGLSPRNPNLEILGATCDHLLLDTTRVENLNVGDTISFNMNYAALLAAMTSPFVKKVFND